MFPHSWPHELLQTSDSPSETSLFSVQAAIRHTRGLMGNEAQQDLQERVHRASSLEFEWARPQYDPYPQEAMSQISVKDEFQINKKLFSLDHTFPAKFDHFSKDIKQLGLLLELKLKVILLVCKIELSSTITIITILCSQLVFSLVPCTGCSPS